MEENKEAVEETVDKPIEKVEETKTEEQPRDDKGRFKSKFESADDDTVIKVDLSKPPPPPKSEEKKEEVVKENVVEEPKIEETKVEEPVENTTEETPVMEEITEETAEQVQETVEEAIIEAEETGKPLPENIQKLVDFMDETGGDINDYVKLNRDIKEMDDSDVLDEYYKSTKSHLNPEERSFLLEDTFGIDETVDDEKTIRKKKIALKEQVAEAKAYLDGQKSKYYEDIKAGSKLTEEQQKAIDFFNRYKKESEEQKKISEATKKTFLKKTDNVFNNEFKGFEYNVGDKKYRFNVKDADKVKTTQSDINNFVNKFTNEKNDTLEDAKGYHKSLFTAMNADAIAKHFYEQGKADAIKGQIAKDKNINLDPRQTHGETNVGGVKYKVLGNNAKDFKFKIKKRK
tara:strand:- start:867 stop:2072 length:1206 start_codon:yes stop_codon:yes gene_type:complete